MSARRSVGLAVLLSCLAAPRWAQPPAGVIEYYHVDALGSVRAVTNASGGTVRTHHYHPFGDGVGVDPTTDPMRFTGKPRDGETGLDYFGARYYAPRLGRFTTVDPLLLQEKARIDPQQWNRYAYTRQNPLRYKDSDGRAIETLWDIASIALSAKAVWNNPKSGSNWGALVIDIGAAVLPGIPAVGAAMGIAGKADDVADLRKFSKYEDITTGKSITNRATDLTAADFSRALETAGFEKSASKDGKVEIFTKNGLTYVIRDFSKSGPPTADVLKDGKLVLKLRLTSK